ncbi:metallophosphoesterase family protein [Pseudoduganella violaceinigra]|uniref:metallophosphoesterase family protein n=1 Tax=Pseudoduganella violaceinigra TaxID=246602 RepID=UPI0004255D3E|nr:metallophosphoesterase [Pseudoduganella violaceinigra]
MQKQKLLATFVHISDLHIGSIDPDTGDANISPGVQFGLDNFPVFDGLLGHRGLALQHLAKFVDDLRDRDEKFHILVSGDVSRFGDWQELALAQRFLERQIDLDPASGDTVGLCAAGRLLTIPGNHDHWAGNAGPVGATPSSYYSRFIEELPHMTCFPLGSHGRTLRLIEIDSDADVLPNSIQRIYARGNFSSQLKKLDTQLEPRPEREVRTLLIHHSRTWPGFELGMAGKAKQDLDAFIQRQDVSVILCGHTHLSSARRHYSGVHECWEFGAGTTTQLDTVPFKWRLKLRDPGRIKPNPNSLFVHRIFDVDGRLEWMATSYIRSRQGFNPLSPPRQFALH